MAEQHDRDQGGELPPDLDLEQSERTRPASRERHDDRERDQGHHPGLAIGEFTRGAADEDETAVQEDDSAEHGREERAREGRDRVAEPHLDVLAQDDDGHGQCQAQPELRAEHVRRVARVSVVRGMLGMVRLPGTVSLACRSGLRGVSSVASVHAS
jgi:hypothetical protein